MAMSLIQVNMSDGYRTHGYDFIVGEQELASSLPAGQRLPSRTVTLPPLQVRPDHHNSLESFALGRSYGMASMTEGYSRSERTTGETGHRSRREASIHPAAANLQCGWYPSA